MSFFQKILKLYVLGLLVAGCQQKYDSSWRGDCKKYYSEDERAYSKCIEDKKNGVTVKPGEVGLEDVDVPTTEEDYGIKDPTISK